jgi:hypothetical protein
MSLLAETDRKSVSSAPGLPKGTKAEGLDSKSLLTSFQYFGQKLAVPETGACLLHSGAEGVGATLLSLEKEPLGKVKEIQVDLSHGRIVYLVIDPFPSLTTTERLYLLPPIAVQPDLPHRTLVLKTNRSHFLAGPSVPKQYPTEMIFPEHAMALLKHYGLEEALNLTAARAAGQDPRKAVMIRVMPERSSP